MLNIVDRQAEERIPAILRSGFRPLFLLGCAYALIAVGAWVVMFQHGQPQWLAVPALWWHVHEMLFGFAMAIVAGFLLTAVQNWTSIPATKGWRLALIVGLWLLVRLLLWTPLPLWLAASIEALFLALTAYEVGIRLVRARGWRNLFFIPLLAVAIGANFASYATIKGVAPFAAAAVWQAMLWWFTLLLAVMGGRVIPFFTARRFQFESKPSLVWLEWFANAPLLALFILSFFPLTAESVARPLMLVAGAAQLLRWWRWQPWRTLSEPLVWSLHAAYLCIPLSLLLRGAIDQPWFAHNMLHLLAIGALAGLILTMVARVSMGHTGRVIYQGPDMSLAFGALLLAAVLRSLGVAILPAYVLWWVNLSALLWIAAFGLFMLRFAPMLLMSRADGHPG